MSEYSLKGYSDMFYPQTFDFFAESTGGPGGKAEKAEILHLNSTVLK